VQTTTTRSVPHTRGYGTGDLATVRPTDIRHSDSQAHRQTDKRMPTVRPTNLATQSGRHTDKAALDRPEIVVKL